MLLDGADFNFIFSTFLSSFPNIEYSNLIFDIRYKSKFHSVKFSHLLEEITWVTLIIIKQDYFPKNGAANMNFP